MMNIQKLFRWLDDWELEKKVFIMMLKGVIAVALPMALFDYFFYSATLAFLELSFAIASVALLYYTLTNRIEYVFSSRMFILFMSLPIYWNLLFNESYIESTVLFIFLPIVTTILRPLKEVVVLAVLFGGSFLGLSLLGITVADFTYMELFKLISTQGLISFFVMIYVQTNKKYQDVISKQGQELQETHENLEILYKEKEREASTDHLTGLNNRAALMAQLEYLYARYKRQKEVFSFIIMDIDKFKNINDTYGHQQGDEVLKDVSRMIMECVREVDTSARYGGEEFVVLLPQTNIVSATHIAERIRESIEKEVAIEGKSITASFGVIEMQEGLDIDELIKRADTALYEAKESGRNRVICA